MTVKAIPRLRIAVLNWFLDDNEPLAGDLIEECEHRSRAWFWSQLMFAVLIRIVSGAAGTPAKVKSRVKRAGIPAEAARRRPAK